MGSNPSRVIPLLGIAHPVERILFQVQGAIGKAVLIRGRFEKKPTCSFDMDCVKHVLNS